MKNQQTRTSHLLQRLFAFSMILGLLLVLPMCTNSTADKTDKASGEETEEPTPPEAPVQPEASAQPDPVEEEDPATDAGLKDASTPEDADVGDVAPADAP